MKITIVANGVNDKLIGEPESDLERAFVMALGENIQNATVAKGQFIIGSVVGVQQSSMIVTVPHKDAPKGTVPEMDKA